MLQNRAPNKNKKTSSEKRQTKIYWKIRNYGVVILMLVYGTHPFTNKKSSLDQLSFCFLFGVRYGTINNILYYNEARERSEPFFPVFPRKKKPLHNGSYEHRVPKIKNKTLFCTRDICVCDCVIV